VKNPLIFRHVLESSTNGGLAYFSERFEAYIAVEYKWWLGVFFREI